MNLSKLENNFLTVKRNDGHKIKKLPPNYPVIGEFEKQFKQQYVQILKKQFLSKIFFFLKNEGLIK